MPAQYPQNVSSPREGKTVYIGSGWKTVSWKASGGITQSAAIRTGYEVIENYHAHGECEQFHSEIKTDMDVERLPSGKFAANELVLELTVLGCNNFKGFWKADV